LSEKTFAIKIAMSIFYLQVTQGQRDSIVLVYLPASGYILRTSPWSRVAATTLDGQASG